MSLLEREAGAASWPDWRTSPPPHLAPSEHQHCRRLYQRHGPMLVLLKASAGDIAPAHHDVPRSAICHSHNQRARGEAGREDLQAKAERTRHHDGPTAVEGGERFRYDALGRGFLIIRKVGLNLPPELCCDRAKLRLPPSPTPHIAARARSGEGSRLFAPWSRRTVPRAGGMAVAVQRCALWAVSGYLPVWPLAP